MTVRHRAWWLAAALVGGVCVAVLLNLPHDRMLLERARIAVPAAQYGGGNYQWLSNTELLLERDWSDTPIPQWGLFRWNLATRVRTYDGMLKALMRWANSEQVRASPNGEWLLSGTAQDRLSHNPDLQFYYVCRTDGSRLFRQAVSHGFMGTRWLADGRHWIEFYGKHVVPAGFRGTWPNMNSAPMSIQQIRVCDVKAPGRVQAIKITPSSLLRTPGLIYPGSVYRLFAISEDRFLTWEPRFKPSNSQVIIREIGANSSAPRHQYIVNLPDGQGVIQLVFTAGGDRVLWELLEIRKPGIVRQAIHRVMPWVSAKSVHRASLWISRIDGSGMHELGGINYPAPAKGVIVISNGYRDPESGWQSWGIPVPRCLRWTPDGKRVSFEYDRSIYSRAIWMVSAD
jgi:hypothetical protein